MTAWTDERRGSQNLRPPGVASQAFTDFNRTMKVFVTSAFTALEQSEAYLALCMSVSGINMTKSRSPMFSYGHRKDTDNVIS